MNRNEKNKFITETIQQADSIAIIPSKIAGTDAFCAGVGLYYVLKQLEKKVQLIYPGKVPDGCEDTIKPENITSNVKRRDLVVAINYKDTEVEKVQYNADDGMFYLRLGPVSRDFDTNRVSSQIEGHKHDVYLIIGAQMPEDLGQTFDELEKELLTGKIINLDNTDRNTRFGHYNVVDPLKDSVSLLAMHSAMEWEFVISPDAARAFLQGISYRKLN